MRQDKELIIQENSQNQNTEENYKTESPYMMK